MKPLLRRPIRFSAYLLPALLAVSAVAQGAVLHVTPGMSIATALQHAVAGDTIEVAGGPGAIYAGHLVIDKPLILKGDGYPVIDAAFQGDGVRIKASDVTVEGFAVRNSGIDMDAQNAGIYVFPGSDRATVRNNRLSDNLFGIWLEKSNDTTLIGNTITGRKDLQSAARGEGIQVFNTNGARIIGNTISYTRDGIYVDVSSNALFRGNRIHHVRYGTHYMTTNHSTWEDNEVYLNQGGLALMEVRNLIVRNNVAWGNEDQGIMLRTIQDSVIEGNVVAGNGRGFFIYDAEYNVLKNNLVIENQVGIHLAAGSINNQVEGNDFIGNREQIKYVATRDVKWGGKVGNYWSNYSGWDQDGDGVGDTPYEANDVVDLLNWQYPLVKLLLTSQSVQTLRFVARQFPLLRAPSVVDLHPHMRPFNRDWKKWHDKQYSAP